MVDKSRLRLFSDYRNRSLDWHIEDPCADILIFCNMFDLIPRDIGIHGSAPYVGLVDKNGDYLGQLHQFRILQLGYNDSWEFAFNPTGLFSKDLDDLNPKKIMNGWKVSF